MKTRYEDVEPYVTKDGSEIRELMHPAVHGVGRNLSLAEARIPPGGETKLHRHPKSEEIYHVLEGKGLMRLGNEEFEIVPGDTILIPPGTPHNVRNTGAGVLRLLCACSPPYSHEDTELMD